MPQYGPHRNAAAPYAGDGPRARHQHAEHARSGHALIADPDRFAAASVTDCCLEPNLLMVYGGTALSDERRAMGFPGPRRDDLLRWKPVSVSLNGEAVKTPLLMSNADGEFIVGVETFMALRDAGKAVEMYVYPREYHLKVQPVQGPVVETLLAEAERADVIAMPMVGRNGFLDALRGSTTERIVREASRPVLALPA